MNNNTSIKIDKKCLVIDEIIKDLEKEIKMTNQEKDLIYEAIEEAYEIGKDRGYDDGYLIGREDGYDDGWYDGNRNYRY